MYFQDNTKEGGEVEIVVNWKGQTLSEGEAATACEGRGPSLLHIPNLQKRLKT